MNRLITLFGFLSLLMSSQALGGTYVRQSVASYPIVQEWYYLSGGTTYEWETTNLQLLAGCDKADTIMRLLDYNSNHVAANDDGGVGYASKINFQAPTSGFYQIIIHSYSTGGCGQMDLKFNGQVDLVATAFGGVREVFTNVPTNAKIQSAFRHGGGYSYRMLVASSASGLGIRAGYGGDAWTTPITGADLIDFPADTNIHAAMIRCDKSGSCDGDQSLIYYPYADGLFDVDLRDFDDETKLSVGLCAAFRDGRACNGEPPNNNQFLQGTPEEVSCPPRN